MFTVQYRPLFQTWGRVKKAFKKVSPSLENWNISIYLCAHFSDMKDYKVVFLLCLSVSSTHQWDRITENQLPNSLGCRADKSDHEKNMKYPTAKILEYVCAILFFFFAFFRCKVQQIPYISAAHAPKHSCWAFWPPKITLFCSKLTAKK